MSFESSPSNEPSPESIAEWRHIEAEVARIRDDLGLEIDLGIRPLVVALKANAFGTTASCEGHLDRAAVYPWVDVESPLAEALLRDPQYLTMKQKLRMHRTRRTHLTCQEHEELRRLVDQQIAANKATYERLVTLLNEFYQSASANRPADAPHLAIERGPWYQSRIRPADIPFEESGRDISEYWPTDMKARKLGEYRKEMQRFADFLRAKYFAAAARGDSSQ